MVAAAEDDRVECHSLRLSQRFHAPSLARPLSAFRRVGHCGSSSKAYCVGFEGSSSATVDLKRNVLARYPKGLLAAALDDQSRALLREAASAWLKLAEQSCQRDLSWPPADAANVRNFEVMAKRWVVQRPRIAAEVRCPTWTRADTSAGKVDQLA